MRRQLFVTGTYRGTQAAACGAAPCASQVLDGGAEAVTRGAACWALHVLNRVAQAGALEIVNSILKNGFQLGPDLRFSHPESLSPAF
jgi:hypothetical protein